MTTKEPEPTEKEVTARLEIVRALYKLMRSLMTIDMSQAKPVVPKQP